MDGNRRLAVQFSIKHGCRQPGELGLTFSAPRKSGAREKTASLLVMVLRDRGAGYGTDGGLKDAGLGRA